MGAAEEEVVEAVVAEVEVARVLGAALLYLMYHHLQVLQEALIREKMGGIHHHRSLSHYWRMTLMYVDHERI